MLNPVYCISGLAADCTLFDRLCLPPGYTKVYLEWAPLAGDSVVSYAVRVAKTLSAGAILIGVSFGGMVSTEIARIRPDLQVVLLSTAGCRKDIPFYFRWLLASRLYYCSSRFFIRAFVPLLRYYLKWHRTDPAIIRQVAGMISQTDMRLFKWSLNSMRTWNSSEVPANVTRVHGTKDIILPSWSIRGAVDHWVEGGGHLMVTVESGPVTTLLLQVITDRQHA